MKHLIAALFLCAALSIQAAEYTDGRIKLVLYENTGRFSLYYMNDLAGEQYIPLFTDEDPRTSFLAVMVNDRNYRLGESSSFRTRIGGTPLSPALIFESPVLTVTEEFSFIKTAGSSLSNGVGITITLQNRGERPVRAGIRFLLDTSLGEAGPAHFTTASRQITAETVLTLQEQYWISGSSKAGLMGSAASSARVHFANWKRLNDAPWTVNEMPGRNFNLLPYSIGDSAVCYYFDVAQLEGGASRTVSLALSSRDESGFGTVPGMVSATGAGPSSGGGTALPGVSQGSRDADMTRLEKLIADIDAALLAGNPVPDDDLALYERVLSELKAKYNLP